VGFVLFGFLGTVEAVVVAIGAGFSGSSGAEGLVGAGCRTFFGGTVSGSTSDSELDEEEDDDEEDDSEISSGAEILSMYRQSHPLTSSESLAIKWSSSLA